MSGPVRGQDKLKEVAFFDQYAALQDYNAFTPASNQRLIDAFVRLTGLPRGARVADLGCGSGVFSTLLHRAGYKVTGVDLSLAQIERARAKDPEISFEVADVENLPFDSESFDGVLLSAIVHHLPDPSACAAEVYRVLVKGGRFMAFDPNRMNPFMYLYRDRSSPFYSSVGVTENERPILAWRTADVFRRAGFSVESDFLSSLSYQYVASGLMRHLLPIYNEIDKRAFSPSIFKRFRAFVLTSGKK